MHDDIHIILDSISDVQDTHLMNDPRISVLRLIARHGNDEWFDGDRSTAYLFDLVKKTGKLPATSQPPIGHMTATACLAVPTKPAALQQNKLWTQFPVRISALSIVKQQDAPSVVWQMQF